MKKENDNRTEMSRRGFLKAAALTGAALCVSPALEKVQAAERAIGKASAKDIPAGMAAVRKQRTLGKGKAAFTVSAMGFGCMGLNYHRSEHPDEAACIRLVHEAIERGVTLFDTAESYGPFTNEVLMGKALKGYTDRVSVTSKFGHKYVNGVQVKTEEDSSPANIRKVCENSLRSLGVEKLDMFYQHRGDPNTPIEVVAETIAELIKEGKILHWGAVRGECRHHPPRPRHLPDYCHPKRIPPDAPHGGGKRPATVQGVRHRLRAIQPHQPGFPRRSYQRTHEVQPQRQPPDVATLPARSHPSEPAHCGSAKPIWTDTRLYSGTNRLGVADAQGRFHRAHPRHYEAGAPRRKPPCHGDYVLARRDAGIGNGGVCHSRCRQPV